MNFRNQSNDKSIYLLEKNNIIMSGDTALINNVVSIQPMASISSETVANSARISPSSSDLPPPSTNPSQPQTPSDRSDSDDTNPPFVDALENLQSNSIQNNSVPKQDTTNSRESSFKFGPYVPMLRTENGIIAPNPDGIVDYLKIDDFPTLDRRLLREILPDDSIVEAPSLVTPILIKKKTTWPPRDPQYFIHNDVNLTEKSPDGPNDSSNSNSSDEIQVIKVVTKSSPTKNQNFRFGHKTAEEYINIAALASLKNQSQHGVRDSILTLEDYYKSSAGEMLLGIGLSRVTEYNLNVDCKRLANRMRRGGDDHAGSIPQLETLRSQLSQAKISNSPYKSKEIFKCPHCSFTTEHKIVIQGHLEIPHLNKRDYLCNWCDYKTKDSSSIGYHTFKEHGKRCRIEKPQSLHLCRFCQFECQSKKKITAHVEKCQQLYDINTYLGPRNNGVVEYPAVTSKLITQEDVKTYEQTLKNLRLAAYNPHQLKIPESRQQNSNRISLLVIPRQNQPSTSSSNVSHTANITMNSNTKSSSIDLPPGKNPFGTTISSMRSNQPADPSTNQKNSALLLNLLSTQNANSCQNPVGLLNHPRIQQSPFLMGKAALKNVASVIMAPKNSLKRSLEGDVPGNGDEVQGRPSSPTRNPKNSTFVICEICDAYIRDLGQLRTHMQSVHKVKIHQRTLESTPPLSCQKCEWRYFTDQGLERHLLGEHALVTTNMQRLIDRGLDSGRCTICGRAYTNNLVAHMKEVHKSNLKQAHLSYKCTVCSATFDLYRLFEDHVYSVHSESVKRVKRS